MSSNTINGSYSMAMPMQTSMPPYTDDKQRSGKRQAPDPTMRVLSQDDIKTAVKAADEQSGHHDIREYVEAAGVAIGVVGAGALLISTHRRWKKAGAESRGASTCR